MENVETPNEHMENTASVECKAPVLDLACPTSPVEQRCPGVPPESAADTNSSSSLTPPLSASGSPDVSDILAQRAGFQGSSKSLAADEDCLICVNRYSLSRLPKILSCQHVFCAVCLKLLLHNEGNTWRISCPVCRKATTVSGGLVSSLRTTEEAFWGLSASPGPNGEAVLFPDPPAAMQPAHGVFYISQDAASISSSSDSNRVAAKRLLFLLLLLVSLVILVLPFLYTGLMKWALCIVVGWGLSTAAVLCWNPQWRCSRTDISLSSWPKTAGHIMPAV